jgi:hypothetical protein
MVWFTFATTDARASVVCSPQFFPHTPKQSIRRRRKHKKKKKAKMIIYCTADCGGSRWAAQVDVSEWVSFSSIVVRRAIRRARPLVP